MLGKLWARFSDYIMVAAAVVAGVAIIFFQGKSAGEAGADNKQRKATEDARERKESVKPADSAATIKRLRDGEF
jgi:hypothetical protein